MTEFQKLCALRNSGKVSRWHVEPYWVGNRQDVSQHTFGVMLILCHICPPELNLSADLLKAALYHDLAEQAVGDIPAPTKWALGLSDKLDKLEQSILTRMIGELTPVSAYENQLLRAADLIDHCLVATEQYAMGNTYMLWICSRLEDHLESIQPFEHIPKAMETFNELRRIWAEARSKNESGLLQDFTNATAWQHLSAVSLPKVR